MRNCHTTTMIVTARIMTITLDFEIIVKEDRRKKEEKKKRRKEEEEKREKVPNNRFLGANLFSIFIFKFQKIFKISTSCGCLTKCETCL